MACTTDELTDHFAELIRTQYNGVTTRILEDAIRTGKPVSFAIYPEEESEASNAQYEFDLRGISADSLSGFASQLACACHDLYVKTLGADLSPDDIYCVDILN